jgi:hypothetical protein
MTDGDLRAGHAGDHFGPARPARLHGDGIVAEYRRQVKSLVNVPHTVGPDGHHAVSPSEQIRPEAEPRAISGMSG